MLPQMAARPPAHHALGRSVRQLREERGLSQESLGFESDLHRTYVGGIERGERNPTFAILLRLAKALDVQPSELLRRAERLPEWRDGA